MPGEQATARDFRKGRCCAFGSKDEDIHDSWAPYKPVGFNVCKGSSYTGRVGIYQIMRISHEMNRIIMEQRHHRRCGPGAAHEGIHDLRQSGLLKVKQGMTSLEEIEAVTNE